MPRRKSVNVRSAKARDVDYTGHGLAEDWYDRAPPDDEYRRRAEDMRWHGVDAHVSYWATPPDWFGLKVDPIPPSRFATNKPPWGGVWHLTLGKTGWLDPSQHKQLKRLQSEFGTPQRMGLHFGPSTDRGHAPLYHTDPLVNNPRVQSLNVMGRPPHITM